VNHFSDFSQFRQYNLHIRRFYILRLFEIIICVSSSEALPGAIERKFLNPLTKEPALPAAIFEGIETAGLRICYDSLNNYSPGNLFASFYTLVTLLWL